AHLLRLGGDRRDDDTHHPGQERAAIQHGGTVGRQAKGVKRVRAALLRASMLAGRLRATLRSRSARLADKRTPQRWAAGASWWPYKRASQRCGSIPPPNSTAGSAPSIVSIIRRLCQRGSPR